MTKAELEVAQFLLTAYARSQLYAEKLDPKMRRETSLVRKLDAICGLATDAFMDVVGRHPRHVSEVELNTVSPAEWTKLPWGYRGAKHTTPRDDGS